MWYERLSSFDGAGAGESLGDLSTVNLERIERQEQMMFEMDWTDFDLGGFGSVEEMGGAVTGA